MAPEAAAAPALEAEPPPYIPPFEPERPPHLPPETLVWNGQAEDAAWEFRLRLFALPVALACAWWFGATRLGNWLVPIFFSMWVHESGHAVTAWLCGYPAFPGPWLTPIGSSRAPVLALLAAAGLAFWVWRGWKERRLLRVVGGGTVLSLQFIGTVLLSHAAAQQLIYFGGDAGALVLGSVLMATVYAPADSRIREGWLRWGFLVIGACAFTFKFRLWLGASNDIGLIPFGANEGSGPSDPSVLADTYHWTVNQLVHRYVGLGWLCLAALAVLYAWGLRQAHATMRAHPAR